MRHARLIALLLGSAALTPAAAQDTAAPPAEVPTVPVPVTPVLLIPVLEPVVPCCVPTLAGELRSPHEQLAFAYNKFAALRDGALKIVRSAEDAPWELYDLAADPAEAKNLAAARTRDVTRLNAAFQTWLADVKRDASPLHLALSVAEPGFRLTRKRSLGNLREFCAKLSQLARSAAPIGAECCRLCRCRHRSFSAHGAIPRANCKPNQAPPGAVAGRVA